MNLGEYEQALKVFSKEISKNKTHRILINSAICMYRAGRLKDAKSLFNSFSKMLEEEPAYTNLYPYDNVLVPMFSKINE